MGETITKSRFEVGQEVFIKEEIKELLIYGTVAKPKRIISILIEIETNETLIVYFIKDTGHPYNMREKELISTNFIALKEYADKIKDDITTNLLKGEN